MEFPPRTSSYRGSQSYRQRNSALPVYQQPQRNVAYSNQQPINPPIVKRHLNPSVPYLPTSVTTASTPTQPYSLQRNFRYTSQSALFASSWGINGLVALGSYSEDNNNQVVALQAQTNGSSLPSFVQLSSIQTHFPVTKLSWEPFGTKLISSSDCLTLYDLNDQLSEVTKLTKKKDQRTIAPITSFDWSTVNTSIVITSSIDTTCTVWDLNTETVTTQLIAHDQEVFDVAFIHNGTNNQFVSVSADGSARLFDIRALNNSTILYESDPVAPLLRVSPSPTNSNLLCTFHQDQSKFVLLDLRATRNPVSVLEGHQAPINSLQWIPNSPNLLASGGDDCQVLVWNMSDGTIVGCYNDSRQVNNVMCSPDGSWIGSVSGKNLQAVSTSM